jgi:hypothetical protein
MRAHPPNTETGGDAMALLENENIVSKFFFSALGTAAALWFLWVTREETPSPRRDVRIN